MNLYIKKEKWKINKLSIWFSSSDKSKIKRESKKENNKGEGTGEMEKKYTTEFLYNDKIYKDLMRLNAEKRINSIKDVKETCL